MKPGIYKAQITQRVVRYPENLRNRFRSLGDAWNACGRKGWSAWEEFEALARKPGTAFETWDGSGFFAEILVAKELHDNGYDCWQARRCHLFLKHNRGGKSKEQTDVVEGILAAEGHGLLRDYWRRRQLSFKPRDPDIVARHPQHGWRFCEVKWKSDSRRPGQLETLAFLHHLLGARVEMVRVVPEDRRVKSTTQLDCTFEFLHGTP